MQNCFRNNHMLNTVTAWRGKTKQLRTVYCLLLGVFEDLGINKLQKTWIRKEIFFSVSGLFYCSSVLKSIHKQF